MPDVFFDGKDFFVKVFGLFGETEGIHLEFVKLVNTEKTASVLAVGAGFFAEAGGKTSIEKWEVFFFKDFVHVIASEGHFGGGDERKVFAFDKIFVRLVGGAWIKPATFENFGGDEVGDGHESKASFGDFFETVLDKGIF